MFNFNSITAIQFRRWLLTALASYLIAGAFAAGYVITVNERPNHPTYALVVGALIAGPLALAFLWPRLKGVKAFGVEISLADVTIPIANRVADELMTNQYFSGVPHLLSNISQAVENPDLQLVEINLRSEPYWWSTRLYLQATLLHDYSNVQRLVFVEGDEERRYVGMSKPADVRQVLADKEPELNQVYSQILEQLTNVQHDDILNDPIKYTIEQWAAALFNGIGEMDFKTFITSETLKSLLTDKLETVSVSNSARAMTLLQFQILEKGTAFVPIVEESKLERVIDAQGLSRKLSLSVLKQQLSNK